MNEVNNRKQYLSADQAEQIAAALYADSSKSGREKEQRFYRLIDELLPQDNEEKVIGRPDAFHNLSVSAIRIANDFQTALEIVEAGLCVAPRNTDLLADAIRYGFNCQEKEKCEQWLSQLTKIPKADWTWRAYSFQIDYLMDACSCEDERILPLIRDYQKAFPDDEDSRFVEFTFYNRQNKAEEAEKILNDTAKNMTFCPKTWLQLADRAFNRGEYKTAFSYAQKLCRAPRAIDSVNMGYTWYLRGMCQYSTLANQRKEGEDDMFATPEYEEKPVVAIYDSFRMALSQDDLSDTIRKKIETQISNLRAASGYPYPDNLQKLLNRG